MISQRLQTKFQLIEEATFLVWKEADEKDKEGIIKNLGRWEAEEIIKEISKEVEQKYGSLQKHESKLGEKSDCHCEVA